MMVDAKKSQGTESQPNVNLWSRDGFLGKNAIGLQSGYTPEYKSVDGPHAPRRVCLSELTAEDASDPWALPRTVLKSRAGVSVSFSRRRTPSPFTFRNVTGDELHFIQQGKVRFVTEFGSVDAGPGDFVCIPKAAGYRLSPLSEDLLDVLIECPTALRFDTPAPFGMIDFGQSLRRTEIVQPSGGDVPGDYHLWIKAEDGVTKYVKPVDPLETIGQVGGEAPVWVLSLSEIFQLSYGGLGGPPSQFLSSLDNLLMLFSLNSRASKLRPPVHHNADYDEIIFYVSGPGAYGGIDQPGTLTIVPKGVTHHGPSEDVPEGYMAWLLETRATMRFTDNILPDTELMETGQYSRHPSEG